MTCQGSCVITHSRKTLPRKAARGVSAGRHVGERETAVLPGPEGTRGLLSSGPAGHGGNLCVAGRGRSVTTSISRK